MNNALFEVYLICKNCVDNKCKNEDKILLHNKYLLKKIDSSYLVSNSILDYFYNALLLENNSLNFNNKNNDLIYIISKIFIKNSSDFLLNNSDNTIYMLLHDIILKDNNYYLKKISYSNLEIKNFFYILKTFITDLFDKAYKKEIYKIDFKSYIETYLKNTLTLFNIKLDYIQLQKIYDLFGMLIYNKTSLNRLSLNYIEDFNYNIHNNFDIHYGLLFKYCVNYSSSFKLSSCSNTNEYSYYFLSLEYINISKGIISLNNDECANKNDANNQEKSCDSSISLNSTITLINYIIKCINKNKTNKYSVLLIFNDSVKLYYYKSLFENNNIIIYLIEKDYNNFFKENNFNVFNLTYSSNLIKKLNYEIVNIGQYIMFNEKKITKKYINIVTNNNAKLKQVISKIIRLINLCKIQEVRISI